MTQRDGRALPGKSDDAADLLCAAVQHLECVRLAVQTAACLEKADPIMSVIDTTAQKIEEATALLEKSDAEAEEAT